MNTRTRRSEPAPPRVTVLVAKTGSLAHLEQVAITEDGIVVLFPGALPPDWRRDWVTQAMCWTTRWYRRPLHIRSMTVHCLAQGLAIRHLIGNSDAMVLDRSLAQARQHTTLSLCWQWQGCGVWALEQPGRKRRRGIGGWWLARRLLSTLKCENGNVLICDGSGNSEMITSATPENLQPWLRGDTSGSLCVIDRCADPPSRH